MLDLMAHNVSRLTATDVMELATDLTGSSMQVAAVLVFESVLDPDRVRDAIQRRLPGVPRLRQRLLRAPVGAGRPLWVDDATFAMRDHFRDVRMEKRADNQALLDVAAREIARPLSPGRPLWSATFISPLVDDRCALLVVFHHVLADGIGGLAALAALVDGGMDDVDDEFPRPRPSRRQLYADAARGRVQAIRRLPAALKQVRTGLRELTLGGRTRPTHSSLNRPVGTSRAFAVVGTELGKVRETAHRHGATVNDVLLAAVAGSLRTLLITRGERVDEFVISVPVSSRRGTTAAELGNRVGVLPLAVPATGRPAERIHRIARITRQARTASRGSSAALIAPIFRLLVWLGVFRWFVRHQRLVHTFVTNLRGPTARMTMLGVPIVDVIPLTMISGNISVAFAALSYADSLNITLVADPVALPDLDALRRALQAELDAFTAAA